MNSFLRSCVVRGFFAGMQVAARLGSFNVNESASQLKVVQEASA